jgi:hypothetical protein
MRPTYSIIDEPRSSAVSHLAVAPLYPLLALMVGGGWIGWPWFAFNAFALGSATRVRENVIAVAALMGSFLITLATMFYFARHGGSEAHVEYALLVAVVWKLGLGYWTSEFQSRAVELRRHFGGVTRNGLVVVVIASLVRPEVLEALRGRALLLALTLR